MRCACDAEAGGAPGGVQKTRTALAGEKLPCCFSMSEPGHCYIMPASLLDKAREIPGVSRARVDLERWSRCIDWG